MFRYFRDFFRYLRERNWRCVRREFRLFKQYLRKGYSDKDLWSLYITFIRFILPRLRDFRNMNKMGYPVSLTEEKWNKKLDAMIYSFESMLRYEDEIGVTLQDIDWKRVNKGLRLFSSYFMHLWD